MRGPLLTLLLLFMVGGGVALFRALNNRPSTTPNDAVSSLPVHTDLAEEPPVTYPTITPTTTTQSPLPDKTTTRPASPASSSSASSNQVHSSTSITVNGETTTTETVVTSSPSPSTTAVATTNDDTTIHTSTNDAEQTIKVTITNAAATLRFSFTEDRATRFTVKNADTVSHTAEIRELGVSVGPIAPGAEQTVTFVPSRSGQFRVRIN